MKKLFQIFIIPGLAFASLSYFYPGFSFDSVYSTAVAAIIFAGLQVFLRPFLKILSLPLNLLTFGLFGLLVNVAILFLLDFLIAGFQIVAFDLSGVEIFGWELTQTEIGSFFSAVVASFLLGIITSVFFRILA